MVAVDPTHRTQPPAIFLAQHLLRKRQEDKLPDILRQVDGVCIWSDELNFLILNPGLGTLIADIDKLVSSCQGLREHFEAPVTGECSGGFKLSRKKQLPAGFLQSCTDNGGTGKALIEPHLIGTCLESLLVDTF